jgi:glycosyltransferase involved in cell wall biosynthesis
MNVVPAAEAEHVLFVTMAGGLGGSVRSLVTLLRNLPDVERTVASPPDCALARLLDAGGLAEHRLALPTGGRRSQLAAALEIARWVRRHATSRLVIHANSLADANLAVPAAALYKVPIVVWVHDLSMFRYARFITPVWRLVAMRFACVSEVAVEMVRTSLPRAKTCVIANPIAPAEVLAAGRHEHHPLTVGFVGTALPYKGFQYVPDVIDELSSEDLHWKIFAGPPEWMPDTWERLRRHPGRVDLCGKVDDLRQVYDACDIVLCPSMEESFGRVAAEAMLNGIPVIASDIPALRSVVQDAGILVPPGDIPAICEAVRRLAADAGLRGRFGSEGRKRAVAYDPATIATEIRHLYRASLAGAGHRRH